ncbi:pirin family protein [Pseudactinotalea sp. HY158]|nr:pirin family protein [Pseudactinotalea sp. HY158]QGH70680.1 pirin family protein [Pseudactinotalea sp. HY158]
MTNLEAHPGETVAEPDVRCPRQLQVFAPRTVPLGGIRAIPVRRTLPHRRLPTIGAWCFLDQFDGGDGAAAMTVLPHPHTGLQTVTWPVAGRIRHRDSLGSDVHVNPGELNLMTAGRGVSHSEFSEAGSPLAGVQLWLASPSGPDSGPPDFEQVTELPAVSGAGYRFEVFIGELAGARSPARVFSPLVGADGVIEPGASVRLAVERGWEHGLLVFAGGIEPAEPVDEYVPDRSPSGRVAGGGGAQSSAGTRGGDGVGGGAVGAGVDEGAGADALRGRIGAGNLVYFGGDRDHLEFTAGDEGARVILIGGEPFEEPVVMFWNFVGRSHDDVARASADWAADWDGGAAGPDAAPGSTGAPAGDPARRPRRFGTVPGHGGDHIPGPELPAVTLRPRRR